MATLHTIVSAVIEDADGDRQSIPIYGDFDTVAHTIADLLAWASVTLTYLDPITDGKIVKHFITLQPDLPAGLKSDPVAGSDVEETGLITFNTTSPGSKAFSQDIPAFKRTLYTGDLIDVAAATGDVHDWVARMTDQTLTVIAKNQDWGYSLSAARKGVKTFRKHR